MKLDDSITLFTGTNGMNTNTDPAHLPVQGYVQPLIECLNVTVEDSGRISRCLGRTKRNVVAGHSMYAYHGNVYFVSGSQICRLIDSANYSIVASLSNNEPVSFCGISDGRNDVIFYSNGVDKGRIVNGQASAWDIGTYTGMETDRIFYAPPSGTLLHYQYGRLFVANGNTIWYSEPFNPYLFDMVNNRFTFPSRIRMMTGINDHIWFSDSERIYCLLGNGDNEPFRLSEKTDYPALHGFPAPVNMQETHMHGVYGMGLFCFTERGICALTQGGLLFNITHEKIELRDEGLKPYKFQRYWAYTVGNHAYFNLEITDSGVGSFPPPPSVGGDFMQTGTEITEDTTLTLNNLDYVFSVYSVTPTVITVTLPEVTSVQAGKRLKFIKRGTGSMIIETAGGQVILSPFGSGTTASELSENIGSWIFLQVVSATLPWVAESMGNFDFS